MVPRGLTELYGSSGVVGRGAQEFMARTLLQL